jgi:hypothetical protein
LVDVRETAQQGVTTSSIVVSRQGAQQGTSDLPGRAVAIIVGSGTTSLTFTNTNATPVATGTLVICNVGGTGHYRRHQLQLHRWRTDRDNRRRRGAHRNVRERPHVCRWPGHRDGETAVTEPSVQSDRWHTCSDKRQPVRLARRRCDQ